MVAFVSAPDAPPYHRNLVLELNRAFANYGVIRHFSQSDLPLAAENFMQAIWIDDLATYAVSDGTDWFPITLGGAL